MAILTIILLVSTAFAMGDGAIRPKTPCEDARDAMTHGQVGGYIPTCDAAGRYTPEQCWGSTGYCWCVTSSGQYIPGTKTPPGIGPNICSTQSK
ncbi:equistatin-like isoform X2 [Oncorhynchus nerka]|uniref:equistatin-like isoform X2 n=1 Tax=Oncorhynchus nerka TaxID=8023 RepID=UPI0031B8314E